MFACHPLGLCIADIADGKESCRSIDRYPVRPLSNPPPPPPSFDQQRLKVRSKETKRNEWHFVEVRLRPKQSSLSQEQHQQQQPCSSVQTPVTSRVFGHI